MIGFSCEGKRRQQCFVPQSPWSPHRRALARTDGTHLDAPLQAPAKLVLEAAEIGPALSLVGEDDPRAVEHELGGDGLQVDSLRAHHLAKDEHRPLGFGTVLAVGLLVGLGRAPHDLLERRPLVRELVIRLDDAPKLLSTGGLAHDLLVPREIQPAGVEGVHLPAA